MLPHNIFLSNMIASSLSTNFVTITYSNTIHGPGVNMYISVLIPSLTLTKMVLELKWLMDEIYISLLNQN